MSKTIFTEIRTEYEFLSRVERTIADALLKDPAAFIACSIGALAKAIGVSQGSINNFAKKFSSGGFSALKLKVAQHLFSREEQPFAVIDSTRGVKAAMETKLSENTAAFRSTLDMNDEESLQNAVNKILAAKKIEVYGIFHSGIAARDFAYQLIQLGIPASFVSDTLMCAVSASMLDGDGLVIAVSSSGRTKEIIQAAELAKANGTPVICLTANKTSPLAKLSDHVLLTASSGQSVSGRSDEIRASQLFVVDTLCSYVRSIIDADGRNHYYKLRDIISSHSIED